MEFSWLMFLAKLAGHADKLDDLVAAIDGIVAAEGLEEHWAAAKALGDLVVPVLASVTGLSFGDEDTAEAHFETLRIGSGNLLKRIGEFMQGPMGQALLALLLKKFMPTA